MFGSVFEYIRDSIDDFLALLHQQLVRDQLAMQELFQRRDALHLFHAHMAILERSMQAQRCSPVQDFTDSFQAEIHLFVDLGQRFRIRGVSAALFLRYVRAINKSLRQLVQSLAFNETTKLSLLNLICDQTENIDTALIDFFEKAMNDRTVEHIEAANLQLIREKATYKNIFIGTSNLVLITDGDGRIVEANPEAWFSFPIRI